MAFPTLHGKTDVYMTVRDWNEIPISLLFAAEDSNARFAKLVRSN